MGTANFADDSYGDTHENLRIPAAIAGANALFWLVGRVFGVVELVGVAFFLSIGLLLTAYVMRECSGKRHGTALICIAGAFPLPGGRSSACSSTRSVTACSTGASSFGAPFRGCGSTRSPRCARPSGR